jgi:hypothetical protein
MRKIVIAKAVPAMKELLSHRGYTVYAIPFHDIFYVYITATRNKKVMLDGREAGEAGLVQTSLQGVLKYGKNFIDKEIC